MIHFVGAGPGAEDLITVRGQRYLEQADVVIYAGSLVNPGLLKSTKETCKIYNSAKMTLEEVLEVMEQAEREQKMTVRLHTGDPCLYERLPHTDVLTAQGISGCDAHSQKAAQNADFRAQARREYSEKQGLYHLWKNEQALLLSAFLQPQIQETNSYESRSHHRNSPTDCRLSSHQSGKQIFHYADVLHNQQDV